MFNTVEIGHKISVLRRRAAMTQMELANKLGISYQAVSNWERGVSMPDISNLKEVANLLNTSVDELIGD
ncbi:MAG: helix-turn-helix transcriptional regulator, partial [Clostridia bacterium]